MARSGIHIKPSHAGLLHEDLGVPQGQKIPASKVAKATRSSNPAVRKRAVFAQNAKGWSHKGGLETESYIAGRSRRG